MLRTVQHDGHCSTTQCQCAATILLDIDSKYLELHLSVSAALNPKPSARGKYPDGREIRSFLILARLLQALESMDLTKDQPQTGCSRNPFGCNDDFEG